MKAALARAQAFATAWGLDVPILMSPMAGTNPVALAAAVADGGGMGALGALLLERAGIEAWVTDYRRLTTRPLQINLWVPDPPPQRDAVHESQVRDFLARFGPQVGAEAADARPPDFQAQCDAAIGPRRQCARPQV